MSKLTDGIKLLVLIAGAISATAYFVALAMLFGPVPTFAGTFEDGASCELHRFIRQNIGEYVRVQDVRLINGDSMELGENGTFEAVEAGMACQFIPVRVTDTSMTWTTNAPQEEFSAGPTMEMTADWTETPTALVASGEEEAQIQGIFFVQAGMDQMGLQRVTLVAAPDPLPSEIGWSDRCADLQDRFGVSGRALCPFVFFLS